MSTQILEIEFFLMKPLDIGLICETYQNISNIL